MALQWIREMPPEWDDHKAAIVGGAADGVFDNRYQRCRPGQIIPGQWWRMQDDDRVVGYGWLDVSWGDAEILLATAPADRGRGIGTRILEHLEREARAQGLNYLTNIVRPTHPERAAVTAWLEKRGFVPESDGRLLRAIPAD